MIDIFGSTTLPALEQSIQFAQARHNVLAGNIANMDTPGYRTRDLNVNEFHERLREAIDAQKNGDSYDTQAYTTGKPSRKMTRVDDAMRDILYHDQSDLSMEKQVAEISKNQGLHNTAIAILSSQYRLLNTAISERV